MDLKSFALAVFTLAILAPTAFALDISSCQALGSAGTTYVLTQNVTGNSCFTISAANVVLDCAGFNVSGTSGNGIYSNSSNTTIKNCNINKFSTGIYLSGSNNGRIDNTTVFNSSSSGLSFSNSNNYNVTNSVFKGLLVAVWLETKSDGNKFDNVTANGTNNGFYIESSCDDIKIYNSRGLVPDGPSTGYGIYAASIQKIQIINSTGSSMTHSGMYFISVTNLTISNSNGTAGNTNGHGIVLWMVSGARLDNVRATSPRIGLEITGGLGQNNLTNIFVSAGCTYYSWAGLELSSPGNIIINLTASANMCYGISFGSYAHNNTIINFTSSSNTSQGVYFYQSGNNTLANGQISGKNATNGAVLFYSGSNNNTIANTTINGMRDAYAVTFGGGTNIGNRFINTTLLNATNLLYISATSGKNTFYWNNFTNIGNNSTNAPLYYVQDLTGTNFYNTTISSHGEGNIYGNVLNGSVQMLGTNASVGFPALNYGTSGTGFPYNSTNSLGKFSCSFAGCADYAPLFSNRTPDLQCGNLSVAGTTYNMTANASINGSTCFNVTAANVTLNCNGKSITGNNSTNTQGIYSNQFNTTVKNCNISNFNHGIYFTSTVNSTIENTTASSTRSDGLAVYITGTASGTAINNSDLTSYYDAFFADLNTVKTTMTNSRVNSTSRYGAYIRGTLVADNLTSYGSERGIQTQTSKGINITNSSISSTNSRAIYIDGAGSNIIGTTATSQLSRGIHVGAANVSIDCQGKSIVGGNISSTYGVYSNQINTTVKNCNISNFAEGIHMHAGSTSGNINNNTIMTTFTTGYGVYVNAAGISITNLTCTGKQTVGVSIDLSGTGTTIRDSYINNTNPDAYGVASRATTTIDNTTIFGDRQGIQHNVGTTISPLNVTNSRIYANWSYGISLATGGVGSPSNSNLINNTVSSLGETAIRINSGQNVSVDCQGTPIVGTNTTSTYGVYSSQFNTTIKNCNISNFSSAVYFTGATFGTITNNTLSTSKSSAYAIYFATGSNNNLVANNILSGTGSGRGMTTVNSKNNIIRNISISAGQTGLYLEASNNTTVTNVNVSGASYGAFWLAGVANNNVIANSTFTATASGTDAIEFNSGSPSNNLFINNTLSSAAEHGVYIQIGSNNTFCLNNFTAMAKAYVNDTNGSNFYNCTYNGSNQGNIYPNVINGSVEVYGTAPSSISGLNISTAGSGFPYSNTTSLGKFSCNFAGCADYAPLTYQTALACGNLSIAGKTYALSINVSINGSTCFTVTAQNVTLNCNGFSITGNNTPDTNAVYSTQFNTTVKGCTISRFGRGVFFDSAKNGTIYNNSINISIGSTLATGGEAITLRSNSNYNTISNNVLWGSTSYFTVLLYSSSAYNLLYNNTILRGGFGYSPYSASGNVLENSTIQMSSGTGVYIYSATDSVVRNVSVSVGGVAGVQVSSNSHRTTIINVPINKSGGQYGIFVESGSNVSIDCQGKSLVGTNSSDTYGIYSSQFNTTVKNCNISNFETGVYLSGATNATVENTSAYSTAASASPEYGSALFIWGGSGNRIIGGSYYGTLRSLYLSNTINNYVANTVSNLHFNSGASNNTYHNITGGNYYSQSTSINNTINSSNLTYLSIGADSHYNQILNTEINNLGVANGIGLSGSQNTTIDCMGRSIRGNNASGIYGIYSNQYNTTIRNCQISNFDSGIYFSSAANGTIENVNASSTFTNGNGIYLTSSSNNKITNSSGTTSTGSYNTGGGIVLYSSSFRNIINNSYGNGGTGSGILLRDGPAHNIIINSVGESYNSGSYCGGLSSWGANYNNTFYNSTGRSNTAFGIQIDRSWNSTVANCQIFGKGIGALSIIRSSFNNTLANNTINGLAGTYGIAVTNALSSFNNTFINNTILNATTLLYIDASSYSNTFCLNNFTNIGSPTTYVSDANGTNFYNCTYAGLNQGNIYANVLNGSVSIYGNNESSIPGLYTGFAGSGYPYSNTTSLGKFSCNFAGCADYAPLTDQLALSCSNLNVTGKTYLLSTDLSINGATCFNVTAANVTLNCNGRSITGNNSTNTFGVYSNQFNTSVLNCNIYQFYDGVRYYGASATNGLVRYVNASNNVQSGVHIADGTKWTIVDKVNASGGAYPIWIQGASNNLTNSTATYFYISAATGMYAENVTLTTSGFFAYANTNVTLNRVNFTQSSGGDGGAAFGDTYGIIINNSEIYANSKHGIYLYTVFATGARNVQIINTSVRASGTKSGIYVTTGSQNVSIDCMGKAVLGSNTTDTYGVYTDQVNTTVKNCNVSNFQNGIYYLGATRGLIQNSTVAGTFTSQSGACNNAQLCISSSASYNNIVNTSSTAPAGKMALYLVWSANSNNITGGTFSTVTLCISSNNTFNQTNVSGRITAAACGGGNATNNQFLGIDFLPGVADTRFYMDTGGQNNTLDCQGKSIIGANSSGSYGVYTVQHSTNIRNCNISNFDTGVYYASGSSFGVIQNVNASTSRADSNSCAVLIRGNNNSISNVYAQKSSAIDGAALYLYSGSGNTVSHSYANTSASMYGFRIRGGNDNMVINTTGDSLSGSGISLDATSLRNTFINSTGISRGGGYGIVNQESGHNTRFIGTTASSAGSSAFYVSGGSNVSIDCQSENLDDPSLMLYMPFEEGSGTRANDWSTYGRNGSLINSPTWTTGKYGGALQFNGSNYVSLAPLNPQNYVTVAGWFKRLGPSVNTHHILFMQGTQIEISIPEASGAIRAGVTTATQGRKVFDSGSGVTDGNWHYLAMTYNGSALVAYIDGVQTSNQPVSGALSTGDSTRIGMYSGTYFANGSIDEVRVYNRSLTQSEVQATMDGSRMLLGTNSSGTYGVYSDQYNTTVENCAIRNFVNGINFAGASYGTIENVSSKTTRAGGYGVYLNGGNYNSVRASNLSSSTAEALYIYLSNYSTVSGGAYSAPSNGSDGVGIYNATGNSISNLVIASGNHGVYLSPSSNGTTVSGNVINSSSHGISLDQCGNNNITFNAITRTDGNNGIDLSSSVGNSIASNVITVANGTAIYIYYPNITNGNNNVFENQVATTGTGTGIAIVNARANNFSNNDASSSGGFGISLGGSTNNSFAGDEAHALGSGVAFLISNSPANSFVNITGSATDSGTFMRLQQALPDTSSNNVIENIVASTHTGAGIYVDGVSGTNITGMNMTAGSGDAIYLAALTTNTLLQNGSVSSDGNGISIDGATGTSIYNVFASSSSENGISVKGEHSYTSIFGATASSSGTSGAGIYLETTYANVSNSSGTNTGSGYGLKVHGSEMLRIADSAFISAEDGVSASFESDSTNNMVYGNTFASSSFNSDLLHMSESTLNTFYWNTFNYTSGFYAKESNGQNIFNSSINGRGEGNSWYNVVAGSSRVSICGAFRPTKTDGVWATYFIGADSVAYPKQYPYNALNARGKLSGQYIVDYAPMTIESCWLPSTPPSAKNYSEQTCEIKPCSLDEDCMKGDAPYCDAGCNQNTHTCYPCVVCESAYCLPTGQACGATQTLSDCGTATCNSGVCTSSGETCPGTPGLSCCPSSYCSDVTKVCVSKKAAGESCTSATDCLPSVPYCTGTPAVCSACLPVNESGCSSNSDCCGTSMCNLAINNDDFGTCVSCLNEGGKTCASSADCCSGLECKGGACAVNRPPAATAMPVLASSAVNGSITCTQNCISTNMPSDPDRDTPVKIEYRWMVNGESTTGDFWHESTTFNCDLIGGCTSGNSIKIQSRACDKYGACSTPSESVAITIASAITPSCRTDSCSPALKCCSGMTCKYTNPASPTGQCLITSPMINCSSDASCLSGMCRPSIQDSRVNVCVNALACNQACSASSQCPSGCSLCADSRCSACINVSSATRCTSNEQCCAVKGAVSGLCNAGACVACMPQAANCSSDTQCCSGSCQDSLGTGRKVCAPNKAQSPLGGACIGDSDCAAGFCDTLNRGGRIGISVYSANRTTASDYGQCVEHYEPYTRCDLSRSNGGCEWPYACNATEYSDYYYCMRASGVADTQFGSWVKVGGVDFTLSTNYHHSGESSAEVSGGIDTYAYNSVLMGSLEGDKEYVLDFWAYASSSMLARYALYDTINNAYLNENGQWVYNPSEPLTFEPIISNVGWKQVVKTFKTLPNAKIQLRFYPIPGGTSYYLDDLSVTRANDFSMLAWVRADAAQPGGVLFSQISDIDGKPQGINWSVSNANILTMGMHSSSRQGVNDGTAASLMPNVSLADGKWHQVALSVDRVGNYTAYIDGALSSQAPFTLGSLESNGTFYIGSPGTSGFAGELGEVRFYKRALTPADVLDHYNGWFQQQCKINFAFSYTGAAAQNLTAAYNADLRIRKLMPETILSMPFDVNISSDERGMIVDYSRFLGAGTKAGAVWTQYGKVGGAYTFANSTDRITLPSKLIAGSGDFTVSAWINATSLQSRKCVLCNSGTTGTGLVFGTNNEVAFFNTGSGSGLYSSTSIPLNTWTHIVGIRKNSTLYIYVNGVADQITAHGPSITSTLPLTIGNSPAGDAAFNGTIDEVRAFSRALTPEEVLALYYDNALASSRALPLSQK